ncbi:MAG: ATP-binding cassette domain-containing protein [Streptosporangiaceae bacterium]|nr:ATP-binding cassette domain-containing protein [Streptosporangiaceae bacterium]
MKAALRGDLAAAQSKAVHGGRNACNHLLCLAQTSGIPRRRVADVLDIVGLTDVARKRAKGLSLGMSQRLGIAATLLGDPQILMFDEPVNGLDPEGFLWIRNLMTGLAGEGRTVFVSSHLMSEMENTGLGEISRRQGQHDQALGYAQQALALYREIGDPYGKPQRSTGRGKPCCPSASPSRPGPPTPPRSPSPPDWRPPSAGTRPSGPGRSLACRRPARHGTPAPAARAEDLLRTRCPRSRPDTHRLAAVTHTRSREGDRSSSPESATVSTRCCDSRGAYPGPGSVPGARGQRAAAADRRRRVRRPAHRSKMARAAETGRRRRHGPGRCGPRAGRDCLLRRWAPQPPSSTGTGHAAAVSAATANPVGLLWAATCGDQPGRDPRWNQPAGASGRTQTRSGAEGDRHEPHPPHPPHRRRPGRAGGRPGGARRRPRRARPGGPAWSAVTIRPVDAGQSAPRAGPGLQPRRRSDRHARLADRPDRHRRRATGSHGGRARRPGPGCPPASGRMSHAPRSRGAAARRPGRSAPLPGQACPKATTISSRRCRTPNRALGRHERGRGPGPDRWPARSAAPGSPIPGLTLVGRCPGRPAPRPRASRIFIHRRAWDERALVTLYARRCWM